ncbi:Fatty acid synthase-like protein [Euroglyphus maynei]|uniref:oleoyl-[acyl-carrier-protein] hydrolase n=1 Tax=Euroglyphus maynei TaxID=6958 RepID=A0A1Y3BFN9_EURMA|nr:Fatty acid synthase-like protein [Euroglyphus maynei]
MEKLNMKTSNESRVEQFMNALGKTSFKLLGERSDRIGVHSFIILKNSNEIIPENQIYINFTNNVKDWFELLQNNLNEIKNSQSVEQKYVWLIANDYHSGILGFTNCLRKEPNGLKIRCIYNGQRNCSIDIESEFFKNIVKLNLQINAIGPDGSFGSYKHFSLPDEDNELVPVEHCFLNAQTRGDLSSLGWFEAQHKHWPINRKPEEFFFTVYYSALNFRDIMLATGKLPPDALPLEISLDDCLLGIEFAGRDENGNRVMGMKQSKSLATTLVYDDASCLTWPIPDKWTMEEAVTIPVAYGTAYYALLIRGNLREKETVLIHSGSGSVGQAAITICLSYNCHLYITVGSEEKRKFLMEKFPQLKPNQFASSRDTAFEKMILQDTNGKGVDIVLNSLADDKLFASINCLAPYGRFLEIGKFDLSQNSKLNLSQIMKNKTFHGILLDNMIHVYDCTPMNILRQRGKIRDLIYEGMENGVIQPLNRTIFTVDECEKAFRYMTTGKHMGKILIKIREEEIAGNSDFAEIMARNDSLRIPALPRTVFHSDKSYIITGGLGGFGLELMNWMIEREARHFVLTSRNGVKNLYQKWRIDHFTEMGVKIEIFIDDATADDGVDRLIDTAQKLAPLDGIFHLAMVIKDGLFDNQTIDSFEDVIKPKANIFLQLDKLTRQRSICLNYFVAFSSVSCGVGNPGQSNYGLGNSVIERVCDQRRLDGLHGLAIQWGPIGDVGYIIDNFRGNDIVICGTVPQRIPSCLNVLDRLLQNPFAVCSSLIWSDKKFGLHCGKTSLIKTVAHILGVKDYEKLEPNVTLGELGMDSLMTVEVKQVIERDYDVVFSLQDLRKLTVAQIIEIGQGKAKELLTANDGENKTNEKQSMDEKLAPNQPIVYLNDIINGDPILFFPPLDSTFDSMLHIAQKLNRPVIGLNWSHELKDFKSINDTATYFIRMLETQLPNLDRYDVVAYSFGGVVALEMGLQLQQKKSDRLQRYNQLILLDSSPRQFKIYTDVIAKKYSIENNKITDTAYVDSMLMYLRGKVTMDNTKIRETLLNMNDNQQRIKFLANIIRQTQNMDIKDETLDYLMQTHYNKLFMVNQYDCPTKQFEGDIILIRASNVLLKSDYNAKNIRDDYCLDDLITGKCHLHILDGDHETFITNNHEQLIQLIRNYV